MHYALILLWSLGGQPAVSDSMRFNTEAECRTVAATLTAEVDGDAQVFCFRVHSE